LPQRILALSASLQDQSYFKYENHLMSGTLTLPSHNGRSEPLPNAPALRALHTAFGERAHEADIEALSAETLLDWTDLARTLTLLSRPLEAAETLFLNGQNASAVNLLWRFGKRAEALRLAEESCANFDERTQLKTRLILASLQLEAGQEKEAKKTFQPLLGRDSLRELDRKKVISLGMQLFPRDELLPLAPGLKSELAYQRAPAIASFLPFPAPVSVFWYEHFLAEDDSLTPLSLFQKIETFLNGDRTRAREILTQQIELRKFPKNNLLLPNDPLYQNILFLKLPESLEIVQKAAWYQLSVRDLLRIIQDDSWPAETRQAALESGLLIDPINPSLHWHSRQNGGPVDEKTIHHLTLGEARLTLNLAALTGKRESLRLAAELADLRDAAAIRCLSILAKSLLAQQEADEAARLYQVLLCGEIAVGTQPATRIPATLENLSNYLKARQQSAPDQTHQKIWQERLRAIGKGQTAQNPSQNSAE